MDCCGSSVNLQTVKIVHKLLGGNMERTTVLKRSPSYFPPNTDHSASQVASSPLSCTPLTFFNGGAEMSLNPPVVMGNEPSSSSMEDTLTNMHTDISLIRQKLEEKKPKKVTLAAVNSKLDFILRLLGYNEENA